MLKKFSLFIGSLSLIGMIACSSSNDVAGGTIDPNTIADASSSSIAESSSSFNTNHADIEPGLKTESSSSSSDYPGTLISINSRNIVIDYIGYSKDGGVNLLPGKSPTASKLIEGDSVNVALLGVHLNLPCDTSMLDSFVEFVNSRGIITALSEDTLYVDIPQSEELTYDCVCSTTIFFTLDKEYADFSYAIFNHKDKMSVNE